MARPANIPERDDVPAMPARATLSASRPTPRRGLSRLEAAMYLGISPSKFDGLRNDGRVGPAKLIDGRKVWDIYLLDEFFDALPTEDNETAEDWQVSL
jgi:hypothetical protein